MALKSSKDARHEIRNALNRKLWAGNVDDASTYLKSLDPKFIKNPLRMEDAVNYLERKKPYVPCYALRSVMDYRRPGVPLAVIDCSRLLDQVLIRAFVKILVQDPQGVLCCRPIDR